MSITLGIVLFHLIHLVELLTSVHISSSDDLLSFSEVLFLFFLGSFRFLLSLAFSLVFSFFKRFAFPFEVFLVEFVGFVLRHHAFLLSFLLLLFTFIVFPFNLLLFVCLNFEDLIYSPVDGLVSLDFGDLLCSTGEFRLERGIGIVVFHWFAALVVSYVGLVEPINGLFLLFLANCLHLGTASILLDQFHVFGPVLLHLLTVQGSTALEGLFACSLPLGLASSLVFWILL